MSTACFLIDTNVISELSKPRPQEAVVRFLASKRLEELFLSVVTLAEIRFGIASASDPDKRLRLTQWLESRVRPMFGKRVLPIDEHVMLVWRQLVSAGRKRGHTFSQPDLLIAATASHHDLALVTRNAKDFENVEIDVINPWKTN